MKYKMKKNRNFISILKYTIYFISIFVLIFSVFKYILFPVKYEQIVYDAANKYKVSPYLVFAVIKQESNFIKNSKSTAGANGLMQIKSSTAKEMAMYMKKIDSKYDIYDPYTNINIGTAYLSKLISKYNGNIYIALCAYNAGMGNIEKWFVQEDQFNLEDLDDVIPKIKYNETKNYLKKVTLYYNIYKYLNIYK